MDFDLKNNLDVAESIGPATQITSLNGSSVDLANFHSAMVVFHGNNGDFTDTNETYVPTLEEADLTGGPFTVVAAKDLIGTFSDLRTTEVQKVGYKGIKQFLRAVLTIAGTTPSIDAGATIIRGNRRKAPSA